MNKDKMVLINKNCMKSIYFNIKRSHYSIERVIDEYKKIVPEFFSTYTNSNDTLPFCLSLPDFCNKNTSEPFIFPIKQIIEDSNNNIHDKLIFNNQIVIKCIVESFRPQRFAIFSEGYIGNNKNLRPSEDPEHLEILFCSLFNKGGNNKFLGWEIKIENNKRYLSLLLEEEVQFTSVYDIFNNPSEFPVLDNSFSAA
jgi:hypothetical protein